MNCVPFEPRWDTQLAYTTRYPIPTTQQFDQHSSLNTETNLRNSPGNRVETSTEKKVARYRKVLRLSVESLFDAKAVAARIGCLQRYRSSSL
jgi:hypothetical protein